MSKGNPLAIHPNTMGTPPAGRYTSEHKAPKLSPNKPDKTAHCQACLIHRKSQASKNNQGHT